MKRLRAWVVLAGVGCLALIVWHAINDIRWASMRRYPGWRYLRGTTGWIVSRRPCVVIARDFDHAEIDCRMSDTGFAVLHHRSRGIDLGREQLLAQGESPAEWESLFTQAVPPVDIFHDKRGGMVYIVREGQLVDFYPWGQVPLAESVERWSRPPP